uniref:tRNA (uridine(54)-C5)-methyltransferase TrmA n=1 Tax=Ningiella ruwaisensis TaxID=2364274 RepID=UPI003BA845C4
MNNSADYEQQLRVKETRLKHLLSPVYEGRLDVFRSPESYYRMRAEFRIWHEGDDTFHIMFDQKSKQKYRVDQLPAACHLINEAMKELLSLLKGNDVLRAKLFQIDYLASTNNEIVISMLYHKQLNESWEQEARKLAHRLKCAEKIRIIGRAKKQKLIIGGDYVDETLCVNGIQYRFRQIENSFTQPNAYINQCMLEWTSNNIQSIGGDLLELYCGAGNFSIPLAKNFENVLGTEISKTSVDAAQHNISVNNISNLKIARLSSEEFTQAFNQERAFYRLKDIQLEEYNFSTVLVDPPRAGIDDDTLKLMSRFEHIVYISCNPETLADNLTKLNKTHRLVRVALFDQFPLTEHIESGVILKKN